MANVGQCLHLVNDFICSEGKYQNYPCPYRYDIGKCKCSIVITEEMAEQWKTKGYIYIAIPNNKF